MDRKYQVLFGNIGIAYKIFGYIVLLIGFNVGAEIEFYLFQQDLENGVPVPISDSSCVNAITLDKQELFLSDLTAKLQSNPIILI